jgi:hypothetical protein
MFCESINMSNKDELKHIPDMGEVFKLKQHRLSTENKI